MFQCLPSSVIRSFDQLAPHNHFTDCLFHLWASLTASITTNLLADRPTECLSIKEATRRRRRIPQHLLWLKTDVHVGSPAWDGPNILTSCYPPIISLNILFWYEMCEKSWSKSSQRVSVSTHKHKYEYADQVKMLLFSTVKSWLYLGLDNPSMIKRHLCDQNSAKVSKKVTKIGACRFLAIQSE